MRTVNLIGNLKRRWQFAKHFFQEIEGNLPGKTWGLTGTIELPTNPIRDGWFIRVKPGLFL